MRGPWNPGRVLLLGVLVLGIQGWLEARDAQAGDAVAALPAPAGAPIASAGPGAPPVAQLDRPEPLNRPPVPRDGQVRPTGFSTTLTDPAIVFRAQAPIATGRQMPVGPNLTDNGTTPYTWRQAPVPNAVAPIPAVPSPMAPGLAAAPDAGTTTLPQPTPMPRADGTVVVPNGTVVMPNGAPIGGPGMPIWSGVVPNGCGPDMSCLPGPCGNPCGPCCDPCCDDGCGWGCNCCPPCNRFYASAEYLLWWVRGSPLPPLVTTGSLSDSVPGAIGQPGTHILFGGSTAGTTARSGLRGTVGYWLNEDHTLGVELSGFALATQNGGFSATSFGSPPLFRPFIDALTGAQTVEPVAVPGVLAGTVTASTSSSFNGGEVNLRTNLWCGCNGYVDALLGFHYLGLTESLTVRETLTVLATGGGGFQIVDRFAAQNRFYGTQVGAYGEYRWGPWSVGVKGTIALGPIQQIVDVSGSTRINGGSAPGSFPGGLLTQASNIGTHTRDVFGFVPEVGVNLGYQFTNHMRAFVGYNFIYWNSVARPGNQVDLRVNPNLIPPTVAGGPALPAFAFHSTDFWAQGLTVGLEFRY